MTRPSSPNLAGVVIRRGSTLVVAGLTGITQIDGGREHVVALKSDGTSVGLGPQLVRTRSGCPALTGAVGLGGGVNYRVVLHS